MKQLISVTMLMALALPLAAGDNAALLDPAAVAVTAPAEFRVEVETTSGTFEMTVHRDWAPIGADRFYSLVTAGYYDGAAFYRVIRDPKPFMAQVGFSPDPEVNAAWRTAQIQDDPVVKSNTRGMVSFAKSNAPNSRTTQFFVNYGNNAYLDGYGFAPFAEVVSGMDVVDGLYAGYGEGAPRGRGPSQARIASEGKAYLEAEFPKLDVIVSARVVPAEAEEAPPAAD
jgi:peptidyl-prolyl cis-trans isomerase A (cyclophilin A)